MEYLRKIESKFEKIESKLESLVFPKDRAEYLLKSNTGIVAAMKMEEADPGRVFIAYPKKDRVNDGYEFVVIRVPTHRVQDQNIQVGDYVEFEFSIWLYPAIAKDIHRIGTPEEVLERWGVDVRDQIGWDPEAHPKWFEGEEPKGTEG